ncbi:MAG: cell division protein FtsX [Bacteroidetes bacterium]|nr:MAG: cell division protein FtsX [Bacteroidota bacterium]
MFTNYLKIAWRNLTRNKVFSIINITGLAIGLSCFLLIALYVLDELSFDRWTANVDRIYRINADIRFGGGDLHIPLTSDMMGPLLKKDYPQVEQYTRIFASQGPKLIRKGNTYINEPHVAYMDSTFFDIFTIPVIAGDTKTALDQPATVVVTESAAKKYFGTTDVVGKTIEVGRENQPFKITAVIRDIPENTHFDFNFLFSMKSAQYDWGQLTSHNFNTYLRFRPGTDPKAFEKNFDQYIDRYVLPYAKTFIKINSMEEFRKSGNKLEYSLMPLKRIHLFSDRSYELKPSGNIQYVYIFSAVALFILMIACINFMNLTTARSANRAREVGIRKVLGTERRKLIGQFLTESTLMVLFSLIFAIAIAYLILPLFNNVADKSMRLSSLFSPLILPLLIALPFAVGLVAGSYPAFFLSAFKPIEVLKGRLKMGSKSGGLRSVLVIFQFCTSIMLIIGTIVIYKQLSYIQKKDLGFNRDQVLIINDAYVLKDNLNAFKNEVMQMNGVTNATVSSFLPVNSSSRTDNSFFKDPTMDIKEGFDMQSWQVDYDYVKTMGMSIIKGRNFSKEFGSDSSAIIINETAAQLMGFTDPIGKKIYEPDPKNKPIARTIIGVVKNFNFETLRENIGPLSMNLDNSPGYTSFKVHTSNVSNLITQIETKWKAMAPGMPFSYRFLDDSFNEMYGAERRVGKIALIFSILAILIACLGLFGLATFIAEQRTKEIGIRKVLGASVQGIVQLLSRDFLKLVTVAFIIAAPISWWAMSKWLNDFAFRIHIGWWIFALAGLLALFIALVTVSFQAIKAAVSNPVKSLRTE